MASPQDTGNSAAEYETEYEEKKMESTNPTSEINDTQFLIHLDECLAGVAWEQQKTADATEGSERRLQVESMASPFTALENHRHWTRSRSRSPSPPATMDPLSALLHDQRSPDEENKTRSEAITLIRARTLTRSSPTESTFQGDMSGHSSSTDAPLLPVQLADLLKEPKKKQKKKKSKKGKKDGKVAQDILPDDKNANPNGDHTVESPSQGSSKTSCQDTTLAGVKPANDPPHEHKTKGQTTAPKPVEENLQKPTAAVPKTKGKQIEVLQRPKPSPGSTQIPTNVEKEKGNNASSTSGRVGSSSQQSATSHTRRASIHQKEKLPPIREVSPAAAKDEENPSPSKTQQNSSPDKTSLTCTPKSTSTTGLSAWTAFAQQQSTPRTDISETSEPSIKPSQTLSIDTQTANTAFITPTAPPRPPPPPPTTTTHAHPSSTPENLPTPEDADTDADVKALIPRRSKKPDGWFWQLDSHGFPCAKSTCEKRCNLWDGATVICPRCGPYSEVRYCTKAHLLEDIKSHWLYCGQLSFQHPCRATSIPRDIREDAVPLLPCLHRYDTPERHRQAVYFNMNARAGDYFIFTDWAEWVAAGFPENTLNTRCSNRVVRAISFDDPEVKDRFRRVLATCLFMTIEVHDLIDYLYRLLRDHLRANCPIDLETALQYQIQKEFAVTIQPQITGERHACETDWDGRNRRNCPDPICRAEYRRLLGTVGGKSYRQMIDHLEGSYWVLRAARTTHPVVKKAGERMKGEGFEDVAEEDCRVFSRGEGWDGFEAGEMEIEGINA